MISRRLSSPTILNYLIGITSPHAAVHIRLLRRAKKYWRAGAALLLVLSYPIMRTGSPC